MKEMNAKELSPLMEKRVYPAISIVLPVHRSTPPLKLEKIKMKNMLKKVQEDLYRTLPSKEVRSYVQELTKTIRSIDLDHLSEGIALYFSPGYSKLLHLPFPVEEKLIISSSYEIRDLLYSLAHWRKYGIFTLSANKVRHFEGNEIALEEQAFGNAPVNAREVMIDAPSRVANFSDPAKFKEINLKKFLKYVDDTITADYKNDYSLIIAGTEKTVSAFKKVSKNHYRIMGFTEGNFDHANIPQIKAAIESVIKNERDKEKMKVLQLLEEAVNKKKCVSGITQAWRAIMNGQGSILLVEKDYRCPGTLRDDRYSLEVDAINVDDPNTMRDAVDELLEYTLLGGGKIVFVDNGQLEVHQKICVITRY